jgi:predicted Holliday junction resolvase-like endonuclease
MKIIQTKIPDVTKDTIDQSKVVLADNIIQNVYPLFDEVYQGKLSYINDIKKSLSQKKSELAKKKQNLEQLMTDYAREKKVSKLLSRIEKLVDSGLVYDGAIKSQTIVLLKVINKLTNEKLDHHLTETMQIIRKRFSRS